MKAIDELSRVTDAIERHLRLGFLPETLSLAVSPEMLERIRQARNSSDDIAGVSVVVDAQLGYAWFLKHVDLNGTVSCRAAGYLIDGNSEEWKTIGATPRLTADQEEAQSALLLDVG